MMRITPSANKGPSTVPRRTLTKTDLGPRARGHHPRVRQPNHGGAVTHQQGVAPPTGRFVVRRQTFGGHRGGRLVQLDFVAVVVLAATAAAPRRPAASPQRAHHRNQPEAEQSDDGHPGHHAPQPGHPRAGRGAAHVGQEPAQPLRHAVQNPGQPSGGFGLVFGLGQDLHGGPAGRLGINGRLSVGLHGGPDTGWRQPGPAPRREHHPTQPSGPRGPAHRGGCAHRGRRRPPTRPPRG